MLPQVDVPLIEIEMFSTKDIVNFRPFLVKEEKMLVMASETNDINDMMKATQQIITNCSFGKIEGDKLPLFELQRIFLKLRSASISNAIDLNMVCGDCGTQYNHQLDLDNLELTLDKNHKNPIKKEENRIRRKRFWTIVQFLMNHLREVDPCLYVEAKLIIQDAMRRERGQNHYHRNVIGRVKRDLKEVVGLRQWRRAESHLFSILKNNAKYYTELSSS